MMHAAPTILPLDVTGVSFAARGTPIIDNVTFEISGGPPTIILGPNGAGKSVLLRLCHGLLQPTAGTVRWGGAHPDPRRRQAMVFQHPIMLRRSAIANVAYALKIAGVAASERYGRARHALARVGLADLADRPARVLSGGEQQRLALARAWALEPEVLFLDEPTASLDPAATRAIETALREIDQGATKIVMTTHDLGQANRLGGEILFIHHGRIIERAAANEFFTAPKSVEAACFIRGELLP